MSRVKRSSGKEYHRLSQSVDSDDEVILYSLSPSSPPSLQPRTSTTEFGNGCYDQSLDLELPTVRKPSQDGKESLGSKRRSRKSVTMGNHFSKEAKACVCFLLLVAVALGVVILAVSKLGAYLKPQISEPSPLVSSHLISTTADIPASTPTTQPSSDEGETVTPATTPVAVSTSPANSTETTAGTATDSGSPPGQPTSTPSPHSPLTPSPHTTTGDKEIPTPASISWEREFFPALTETTLQLQDMNRDGITDVVMVEGLGTCDMILRALDGLTGDSVWEARLKYDAFAVKCDIDLNDDDIIDCIAAGRQSGFRALSGADGSILWDRDPNLAYLRYNFYFPLIVPDLDYDGVPDLVNTHGGDATYGESVTERSPSFLVVVSGRTGQQLMERVPVPDGHETYMSPVYLSRGEGLDGMILVGTGGETLPGSLWAISYNSLRSRILRYRTTHTQYDPDYTPFREYINHACNKDMTTKELEDLRPVFDPESFDVGRDTKGDKHLSLCRSWGSHHAIWNEYGLCVYQLLTTEEKGVMLPPVIVDMTEDAQDDLVVSTFDGRTLVINGNDTEVVWEVTRPGTESYSVPAPLFYNNDSIPDLLVRINYGVWGDHYNSSTIAILDGRTGDTLWYLDSRLTGMMSGLSLATNHPGADSAVFIAVGTMDEEIPLTEEHDVEHRRAVTGREQGHHLCLELGSSCWKEGEERWEGRERRHGGPHDISPLEEDQQEQDFVEESLEAYGPDGSSNISDYEDFMVNALAYKDPVGLWDGEGEEFPDAHANFSAFLSYCGWSESELTASVYVLRHQQILTGFTPPLFSHGPMMYFPGAQKRHGSNSDQTHSIDLSRLSPAEIKTLRCSHIMASDMVVSSPAIGDLNSDGRLELVYIVVWGGADSAMGQDLPPRFKIFVATLEDRLKEVFGEEGVKWAQEFLPAGQQPWTRYMGATGNNIYQVPSQNTRI